MKKTTTILSLALAGSLAVTPAMAAGLFHDVSDDHWFSENVAAAYDLGLMQGVGPDTFAPHSQVTLGSAVAMAARLHAGYHADSEIPFDQSAGDHWYTTYVDYAVEQGFFDGGADYDYAAQATRAQLAALLHAALPDTALKEISPLKDGGIPDVAMDDDYAAAIYALYRAGILAGAEGNGAFLPGLSVTRAEAAAIATRAADPALRLEASRPEKPNVPDRPETSEPPDVTPAPEIPKPPETPAPPAQTPAPPTETPAPSNQAQAILDLVNAARRENGLSPMTLDQQMVQAGNVRAKEIVGAFSHTRPDGSGFQTAMTQADVTFRAWGENIAWGQPTAQAVMDTWMNSSGHRANILSANFGRLGVGVYETGGRTYWVQVFAD